MSSIQRFHAQRLHFSSDDGVTRYGVTFDPRYFCIWEGALDSNSNGSVTVLINGLIDAGYAPEGITSKITSGNSKFGPKVTAALKKFQAAKGLLVDGVAGPGTWKALGLGYAVQHSNCPYKAGQFPYGTKGPERPADSGGGSSGGGGGSSSGGGGGGGGGGVPAPPSLPGETKFYEEPWFLPVAVGGSVLAVAVTVAFWPRKGAKK